MDDSACNVVYGLPLEVKWASCFCDTHTPAPLPKKQKRSDASQWVKCVCTDREPWSCWCLCRPGLLWASSLNTNRAALINRVDSQPWLSDYQPLSVVHLWFKWGLQLLHSWWNDYLLVQLPGVTVRPGKLSAELSAARKKRPNSRNIADTHT